MFIFLFQEKLSLENMRKYLSLIAALSSSIIVTAQVQVRNEPRHHNVFENEFVRILDVYLGPGDTTLYHLHNTPSVFIIFTNTNVGSQLIGKQPQKGANITGEVSYDSLNTPRIHRVWNEDTSWFHVMDIELTSTKQNVKISPLKDTALKLLFNEQQVNGYNIGLKPNNTLELPASVNGYLLVSQTASVVDYNINGVTQHRMLKPAHYIWVEPGRNFSLKTNRNNAANFVLLQFK
jgi:hypothetical protein